jgi:uncharacterized protein YcbX
LNVSVIGKVESLWRYPVKSMRGEELEELFASYAGIYGDRLFAFQSSSARKGLPFLTGRDQRQMIRYRPRFRDPKKATQPVNLGDAAKLSPRVNPVSANAADMMVDVETPDGNVFAIDDPKLIEHLQANADANRKLALLRSDKAMTDCCPMSIISMQTIRKVGKEAGVEIDKRRFRANAYIDLDSTGGFAEDEFVGKSLRIGAKVVVHVVARDGRCVMITIDPDTAEKTSSILKAVAQNHQGMAGVYAAILTEGLIRKGDTVEVLT